MCKTTRMGLKLIMSSEESRQDKTTLTGDTRVAQESGELEGEL